MDPMRLSYSEALQTGGDSDSPNPLHNILVYETIGEFTPEVPEPSGTYLFSSGDVIPQTRDKVMSELSTDPVIKLLIMPNVCIFGKRVLATVLGLKCSNIDLRLYGCDDRRAQTILEAIRVNLTTGDLRDSDRQVITDHEPNLKGAPFTISRSKLDIIRTNTAITFIQTCQYTARVTNTNFVTIQGHIYPAGGKTDVYEGEVTTLRVRLYLGIYKSLSQLLHAADVDCHGIAYDGQHVLLTPRCMYAIKSGHNTVNLDLAQVGYERRLLKYAYWGMKIFILEKVVLDKVQVTKALDSINISSRSRLKTPPVVNGLLRLLVAELAYTRDGNRLFEDKADRGSWQSLPRIFHSHISTLAKLPLESRQCLTWIYSNLSVHGQLEKDTPINFTAKNISAVLEFLSLTVDGFLGATINFHLEAITTVNKYQTETMVDYFKRLLSNRRLECNQEIERSLAEMQVLILDKKLMAIKSSGIVGTVPAMVYSTLVKLLPVEVSSQVKFIDPGSQRVMLTTAEHKAWMSA